MENNNPTVPATLPSETPSGKTPPAKTKKKTLRKGENTFYRAFEERYRGSRELIKGRLQAYLPFVMHCQELYEECTVLDLGCGRGEWLELLAENGFNVFGVDLDEGMLAACEERNLPVENKDALVALQERPAQSLTIVSGFHIAEHLPFETLQNVVKESLRVLKPGGLLILETPNPENIVVGTANFYLDPTHQRPLPPGLLSFLPEHYGFARTKVLRLQESSELRDAQTLSVVDILGGVSPDYAVVAQKKATAKRMALFDAEFEKEFGLTINTLATRYDASVDQKIESRIDGVEQSTEARLTETMSRIDGVEQSTEARLTVTMSRIDGVEQSTEARLTETMSRIDGVEQATGRRIGELRGDIAALDRSLEVNSTEHQRRLEETNAHVSEHQRRLEETNAHVSEHQRRLDETNAHMSEHQRRLDETNAHVSEHQRRLDEAAEVQAHFDETQAHFARTLEAKFGELEARTLEMEAAFRAIRNSRSWKMTAPYRALGDFVRAAWQGFKNLLKPPASVMMRFVIARPTLNRFALALLRPFPALKARLKRLALARGVVVLPESSGEAQGNKKQDETV